MTTLPSVRVSRRSVSRLTPLYDTIPSWEQFRIISLNMLTDCCIHTWKHCGVVETSISSFSLKSGGKTRSSSVDRVANSGNKSVCFSLENSVVTWETSPMIESSAEDAISGNGSICFSVEYSLVDKRASHKVDSVFSWISRRFSSFFISRYKWFNMLVGWEWTRSVKCI